MPSLPSCETDVLNQSSVDAVQANVLPQSTADELFASHNSIVLQARQSDLNMISKSGCHSQRQQSGSSLCNTVTKTEIRESSLTTNRVERHRIYDLRS